MNSHFGVVVIVVFLAAGFNFASPQEDTPKDQPNFPPQITTESYDGHDVEIIEFKCKLE